jgi:hypothetical protein
MHGGRPLVLRYRTNYQHRLRQEVRFLLLYLGLLASSMQISAAYPRGTKPSIERSPILTSGASRQPRGRFGQSGRVSEVAAGGLQSTSNNWGRRMAKAGRFKMKKAAHYEPDVLAKGRPSQKPLPGFFPILAASTGDSRWRRSCAHMKSCMTRSSRTRFEMSHRSFRHFRLSQEERNQGLWPRSSTSLH